MPIKVISNFRFLHYHPTLVPPSALRKASQRRLAAVLTKATKGSVSDGERAEGISMIHAALHPINFMNFMNFVNFGYLTCMFDISFSG